MKILACIAIVSIPGERAKRIKNSRNGKRLLPMLWKFTRSQGYTFATKHARLVLLIQDGRRLELMTS